MAACLFKQFLNQAVLMIEPETTHICCHRHYSCTLVVHLVTLGLLCMQPVIQTPDHFHRSVSGLKLGQKCELAYCHVSGQRLEWIPAGGFASFCHMHVYIWLPVEKRILHDW